MEPPEPIFRFGDLVESPEPLLRFGDLVEPPEPLLRFGDLVESPEPLLRFGDLVEPLARFFIIVVRRCREDLAQVFSGGAVCKLVSVLNRFRNVGGLVVIGSCSFRDRMGFLW